MAKLEENMAQDGGSWAPTETLPSGTRIGYTNNFVMLETKDMNGEIGVYNLVHIPAERFESFLAWLASLE